MQLKASAPGSLMLLGEYAVLDGKHALVCAINKRISVILKPRTDTRIELHSTILGLPTQHYATDLTTLDISKPFDYVLGVFKHYQSRLRRGCDLEITSEFSDKVGLGSSAAVLVATLLAVVHWLDIKASPLDLVRQGRQIVKQVQGIGSGADIAASVYGGLVGYRNQPIAAEKFSITHPISVLYSGFKTPTVQAIKQVQQRFLHYPQLFRAINTSIGQCAADGITVLRQGHWDKLGDMMNIQQGMLDALGVNMPILQHMVTDLRKQPGILGAKISGSGLGDCVIALGELAADYVYADATSDVRYLPLTMTLQGAHCDKS